MKLAAVELNPLSLQYIKEQEYKVQRNAIKGNPFAAQYLNPPNEKIIYKSN